MKYYKVILDNGEELYHESKVPLSHDQLMEALQFEAKLSPVEVDEVVDHEEIQEEEYEENCF